MPSKFLNISVDNTLGGNSPSDTIVSSQKAIKEYVDTQTGQTAANQDLSNLTSVGANISNWSTNISSGIVEIPEDIKCSFSGAVFTLKSGSKYYVPNGTSTFDTVTTTSHLTVDVSTFSDGTYMVFARNNATKIDAKLENIFYSGSSPTITTTSAVWYNTASAINCIKYSSDSGSTWSTMTYSFPLAKIAVSGGVITSILQVYNGVGYIGSSFYVLPGVKSVCSNGRNADGTLKGVRAIKTSVSVNTNSETNQPKVIMVRGNAMGMARRLYVSAERPVFEENVPQYWYNPVTNIMWFYQTSSNQGESNMALLATANVDGNKKIVDFAPRTVFRAVDYNDFSTELAAKQDKITYDSTNSRLVVA